MVVIPYKRGGYHIYCQSHAHGDPQWIQPDQANASPIPRS